jgi:hypothetical protein
VEAEAMKIGYFTLSDNNYGNVRAPNDLLRHVMENMRFFAREVLPYIPESSTVTLSH